ncbi:MAG: hypothetical protein M3R02_02545 [Chloroflexota bacterium]|nr:hypothetical protein [Chloroflexota bacterium]
MDRYIKTVKLKGSPAQVAWATDIRARLVAEAEQACRTFLASLSGDPELRTTQQQEIWAAMTAFAGKTDARWWIKHRDESGGNLFWSTIHERD